MKNFNQGFLDSKTIPALIQLCRNNGIRGYSGKNK